MVYFATVLIPFVAVMTVGQPLARLRRTAVALGSGALIAATPLGVYLVPYWQANSRVGERAEDEAQLYSAERKQYLASTRSDLVLRQRFGFLGSKSAVYEIERRASSPAGPSLDRR